MMKPLMLKVFNEELSDLNWDQKAISVASHNGTSEHVKAAQSLLPQSDWGLMQTPLDLPLVQFGRQVEEQGVGIQIPQVNTQQYSLVVGVKDGIEQVIPYLVIPFSLHF